MSTDRRTFLQLLSTGAFAAAYEGTIRKALAIPAHHRTGTIADVEHIVILMQENRSFECGRTAPWTMAVAAAATGVRA